MTKETAIIHRVEEISRMKIATCDWFHTKYLTELGIVLGMLSRNKAIVVVIRHDNGFIEFLASKEGDLSKIPNSTYIKL